VLPNLPSSPLAYRLVPLTKDEFGPLARAWLEIVRVKTEEIAERQVELLHDPSAATGEAYQAIAKMVEDRARLFERFSMVVNALQDKGGDEALVTERESVCSTRLYSRARKPSPWLSSRG
jgi:small conductance mechanosensitive channel